MAAAEFALIAPVLLTLLLGSFDVSRMVQERIALGTILRAGAEAAFRDRTKSQIEATMRAASDVRLEGPNTPYVVVPIADQFCKCPPPQAATEFTCVDRTSLSYPCGATVPAYVYWRLSVQKTVETVLLPSRTLNVSITVMIR